MQNKQNKQKHLALTRTQTTSVFIPLSHLVNNDEIPLMENI